MKKSLFPFLLTFTLSLVVFSGSSGSCTLAAQTVNPLPQHPDTLRILAIGNSFSIDGMVYLPKLLENAGIHNVILGNLYIGGCSLERHCNEYETSSKSYVYYKSGPDHTWKSWKNASLKYGIKNEDWDIITVQESSGISGIYDNIHTWLPRLMEIVRKECTNPDVAIVWRHQDSHS